MEYPNEPTLNQIQPEGGNFVEALNHFLLFNSSPPIPANCYCSTPPYFLASIIASGRKVTPIVR